MTREGPVMLLQMLSPDAGTEVSDRQRHVEIPILRETLQTASEQWPELSHCESW